MEILLLLKLVGLQTRVLHTASKKLLGQLPLYFGSCTDIGRKARKSNVPFSDAAIWVAALDHEGTFVAFCFFLSQIWYWDGTASYDSIVSNDTNYFILAASPNFDVEKHSTKQNIYLSLNTFVWKITLSSGRKQWRKNPRFVISTGNCCDVR